MRVEQAVFLVGGLGTRLGSLTAKTPKPLLPIGQRPFLDYLLDEARRYGFRRATLLAGFQSNSFFENYQGRRLGEMTVDVIAEPTPIGTGGALAHAAKFLNEFFYLLNGDSLSDFNWRALETDLHRGHWIARVALLEGIPGNRYGRVAISNGRISNFSVDEHPSGPINSGIYLMRKTPLSSVWTVPGSLERNILPQAAKAGQLEGRTFEGCFIDIGVPEDFARAQSIVPAIARRPAVFLDRDGVLNQDLGYVHHVDQFTWTTGATQSVRWLNDMGYFVFVITNQSGVARGYYPESAVQTLHNWMQDQLCIGGAHVDGFEYCPFHPEAVVEAYRRASPMRKPEPGMIVKCFDEWPVIQDESFLIGDQGSDMQAARAAGIRGHLFHGGDLLAFVKQLVPTKHRKLVRANPAV